MEIIAHIETQFSEKFGIPRQAGLVKELRGRIVFEEQYRDPSALRGLEGFSHLWLIWEFSENIRKEFSPTVRPPRLGGNERMGVFATRSPFRPNPIGLSCVEIEKIELNTKDGPVIYVRGADLMSGTPIFDIKPYIPYADSYPEAKCGFTSENSDYRLKVLLPERLTACYSEDELEALKGILSEDPRPQYKKSKPGEYGLSFAGHEVRFEVDADTLTVTDIR